MATKNVEPNQELTTALDSIENLGNYPDQEMTHFTLHDMSRSEIKRFCAELQRIKNKRDTEEKVCEFKLVTEDAKNGYMKRTLLKANAHMVSAYISEQLQ